MATSRDAFGTPLLAIQSTLSARHSRDRLLPSTKQQQTPPSHITSSVPRLLSLDNERHRADTLSGYVVPLGLAAMGVLATSLLSSRHTG